MSQQSSRVFGNHFEDFRLSTVRAENSCRWLEMDLIYKKTSLAEGDGVRLAGETQETAQLPWAAKSAPHFSYE